MDPRFAVSREDLYNLQMEVKQVQFTQGNHADRILRLEKRQADDAALKSVWNSPFPGVLAGTPQQGPVHIPHNEMFDDLDEQGEQLLGSLHLGPAEEEPVRRGAASRANSVRFDESALHGSSWGGQNNRHSGEFVPVRPGSGLMMERSLSHKSDGRHSSAGHSVHSHHSVASGRASSLGLDTNFPADDDDDDDDSSFDIPGPPVSFYVLGSVPSIVRCWMTTNYAHSTLLYADLCTGSQRSTIDFSLIKELDLLDEVHRDADGMYRARLNVYFAEAVITQRGHRSSHADGSVPSMTVFFEVCGTEEPVQATDRKTIRIFIGSDALRAHSADVMLSQNHMLLYGNERDRLRVPFVRPEDDAVFRNICTANIVPGRPKLNANATPFVTGEANETAREGDELDESSPEIQRGEPVYPTPASPTEPQREISKPTRRRSVSDHGEEGDKSGRDGNDSEPGGKGGSNGSDASRRESSTGIWGSWRHGGANGPDGFNRDNGSLSGYQPAARGRSMKVLKPQKSGSTSTRTGASYEPPLPSKSGIEARRKSQASSTGGDSGGANGSGRWDVKRAVSSGSDARSQAGAREPRNAGTLPRSVNPVGGASAFSWMAPPPGKPKSSTTAAE